MRSIINYPFQPLEAYSSEYLNAGYTPGIDKLYLNKLYTNVCCNDLESFETLHRILYPYYLTTFFLL